MSAPGNVANRRGQKMAEFGVNARDISDHSEFTNFTAAVLGAGFGGFALGATPTAIANMTAVTKANGPAPLAFIILPLVAAFFVDVTNALIIRAALSL